MFKRTRNIWLFIFCMCCSGTKTEKSNEKICSEGYNWNSVQAASYGRVGGSGMYTEDDCAKKCTDVKDEQCVAYKYTPATVTAYAKCDLYQEAKRPVPTTEMCVNKINFAIAKKTKVPDWLNEIQKSIDGKVETKKPDALSKIYGTKYILDIDQEPIPEKSDFFGVISYSISVPKAGSQKKATNESNAGSFSLLITHYFAQHDTKFTITVQSENNEGPVDVVSFSFSEKMTEKQECPFDFDFGILPEIIGFNNGIEKEEKIITSIVLALVTDIEKVNEEICRMAFNNLHEVGKLTVESDMYVFVTKTCGIEPQIENKEVIIKLKAEFEAALSKNLPPSKKLTKNTQMRLAVIKAEENLEKTKKVLQEAEKALQEAKSCKTKSKALLQRTEELKKQVSIYQFIIQKPNTKKHLPETKSGFRKQMLNPLIEKLKETQSKIEEFEVKGWQCNKNTNIVTNPDMSKGIKEKENDLNEQLNTIKNNQHKYKTYEDFMEEKNHPKFAKTEVLKVLRDIKSISEQTKNFMVYQEVTRKDSKHSGYIEVKYKNQTRNIPMIADHEKSNSTNVTTTTTNALRKVIEEFLKVEDMLKEIKAEETKKVEEKNKLLAEYDELRRSYKENATAYASHLHKREYLKTYIQNIVYAFNEMKSSKKLIQNLNNHYDTVFEKVEKRSKLVEVIYKQLEEKIIKELHEKIQELKKKHKELQEKTKKSKEGTKEGKN